MSSKILSDRSLDAEYKVLEDPRGHKHEIRLWLRLLTCTKLVETSIRQRLREEFQMTLPRFDLMAQLERSAVGLSLSDLSERLMVSNGNVTGLVERLAKEGLVVRVIDAEDRRAARVHLTDKGRTLFSRMAVAHRGWVSDLFAGLASQQQQDLWEDLGRLKASVRRVDAAPGPVVS